MIFKGHCHKHIHTIKDHLRKELTIYIQEYDLIDIFVSYYLLTFAFSADLSIAFVLTIKRKRL
jgi:hypothetical protein